MALQGLAPKPEGGGPPQGVRPGRQVDAVVLMVSTQLADEARLSHARFPENEHAAELAVGDAVELGFQHRQFHVPTHQLRAARWSWPPRSRLRRNLYGGFPLDRHRGDRLGQAFQLELSGRAKMERPAG